MMESEDFFWFWLGISGVSARRLDAVLSVYSPVEIWEKIGGELSDPYPFGEKAYESLLRYHSEELLRKSMERLDDLGIGFVTRNRFSERLSQREVRPPAMLYYRGDISLLHTDCVGVVGTRECTAYGKDAATRLAYDLCASGVTVVSGLATGIDAYAHRAALKANGKTIAVLGSGLNCVAPVSNMGLYEDILRSGGLVVSEYAPQIVATRYTFPERNRIISGLSAGVIVVEAREKSGALITAEFAAEQNRTVFAVPGNITSARSSGCNRLLYDGATPALCAQDICDCLNISAKKSEKNNRVIQLDIFEQKIYNILISGERSFDDLVEQTALLPPKLSALLSAMEIKGAVVKKQSNIYTIA